MQTVFDRSTDAESIPYCPDGFALRKNGLFLLSSDRKSEERIAGPVIVKAFTRETGTGRFGFVLAWRDLDDEEQEAAFPLDLLHEQGAALAKALAIRGLSITPGRERVLLRYLGGFDGAQVDRVESTRQLGWLDSREGTLAYVLPTHTIQSESGDAVFFQPEAHSPTISTIHKRGNLKKWQQKVASQCHDNPYLLVSLAAAFAAPLLRFARLESGGIHFFGKSSRGKTTAVQVAASVFGCGADPADMPDQSFVQRWNTTANALEGLGAAHNDGLLILDEIHTCNARDFGAVVYNLFGGKGKQTLTRDRVIRPPRTWRVLALSTGEISSRQKIEETAGKAHAGQMLRLVDIPIDETVINETNGLDAHTFVKRLKRACGSCYGSAGPAFIEALVEHFLDADDLSFAITRRMEIRRESFSFDSRSPERQRVAERLLLIAVAGELAYELGIVGIKPTEFLTASTSLFRRWCASGADITDAVRGAVAVQDFIHRHQSRFVRAVDADGNSSVREIVGYIEVDKSGRSAYLFTADGFKEATRGYNATEVARELRQRGLLIADERGRYQTKRQIADSRSRVYAVRDVILEHEFAEFAGAVGAEGQWTD